jgi:hypothetical protein
MYSTSQRKEIMGFQNHNYPAPGATARSFFRSIPAPIYAVWACIIAVSIVGLIASVAEAEAPAKLPRVCYSAADWGPAPDSQRPCYTVAQLFEDGSGRIVLGSASTPRAACRIPNVTEETGTFTVQCSRIGGPRR